MEKGKRQQRAPIVERLNWLTEQEDTAFYAPGHKQGKGISPFLANWLGETIFRADLPELPELDNLFAPSGVIAAAQTLASEAFGAKHSWFLVNGSTCGVIAAILATCRPGDKIILPRNVHQSAIAGLILSGAIPIFIQPEYDSFLNLVTTISPEAVAKALNKHPDTRAVLVVYPTYQGICTDLSSLVTITHSHDIPLLVDEAHGAHFHFHSDLPPSALSLGADIVIQSTHKVLGAFTQAAMLHMQGDRLAAASLSQVLQLVQSTSPNYLLLASLDAARQQMAMDGERLLTQTIALAKMARKQLNSLAGLTILDNHHLPSSYRLDTTRLTVIFSGIDVSGFVADKIMRQQYQVTAELPLDNSLTLIISIGNREQDIEKLIAALTKLTTQYSSIVKPRLAILPYLAKEDSLSLSPRDAYFASKKRISTSDSIGKVSAELICPYPPGIPVLMPGEIITVKAIAYLQEVLEAGAEITGCSDPSLETLLILS